MQIIPENENEKSNSGRIDPMGVIICTSRIGRCMKRKFIGRFRNRRSGIWVSRGIFVGAKKKFRGGDEELVKIAELRRIEQGERIIEEFVQEFQRAVRESKYKGRALVEEFKRGMSGAIRRKLMEVERPPTSIDQWYKCATNLDRH